MSADPTIYCLEQVTDYYEFERLCHDLMALSGYPSIEPLGGFQDKGRDAVHVSAASETTLFAYSVREDWRAKLAEDATKIHRHGHTCQRLAFVTTARFSSQARDEAITYIRESFGWELDLYGLERLRILLDVNHPQIKLAHPQIFPPQFLGPPTATQRDHLFISYAAPDRALAAWLARKLLAEGYAVWCQGVRSSTESYPDQVETALRSRTYRTIAAYSSASQADPELSFQRALAITIAQERQEEFLIPLDLGDVDPARLDRATRALRFISFHDGWAPGLRQLLERLHSTGCPRPLFDGRSLAAHTFLEEDLLTDVPDTLISNCLRFKSLPELIRRFEAKIAIPRERLDEIRRQWCFREVNPRWLLAFENPPLSVIDAFQLKEAGGVLWRQVNRIDGIASADLVSDLTRQSLIQKCLQRGLQFCPDTHLLYFPPDLIEGNRLRFTKPTGTRSFVSCCGQRKFWKPSGSEEYQYHLAPVLSVVRNLVDDFNVIVRIRVRLSDLKGTVLPPRTALSRRKHLCKNWWNEEWLHRTLAVIQFLADGDAIVLGQHPGQPIIIEASPIQLSAPIGINETQLGQALSIEADIPDEEEDSEEEIDESEG